jgi:hypothetical protein
MCVRRAPEKYIASAKAPAGAALDRAVLEYKTFSRVNIFEKDIYINVLVVNISGNL